MTWSKESNSQELSQGVNYIMNERVSIVKLNHLATLRVKRNIEKTT